MKKTTAVAMALVLCMLYGGATLAENAIPTEEPISEGTVLEETVQTEKDGNSFLAWIGQGWNQVTDFVESGANTVSGTVVSWANVVGDTLGGWYETVETYLSGNQWTEDVQKAWNTLKEGAEGTGKAAGEELENAYHTVRSWIAQSGEKVDQGIAAAVDCVASAGGVIEAQVSVWYRTVETFMTTSADTVSDAVRQSWETIKQANTEGAAIAKDKLADAWQTVHDWLASQEKDTAEEQEALDGIMNQLEQEKDAL